VSLWLCLRFDRLALEALSHSEEQPIAVLTRQRVICANDTAGTLGIRTGMGTATVRALAGAEPIKLLERDIDSEQRCMHQLCCWAYSITPTLYNYREDCLQLEIGGCISLFKGLEALLAEVRAGISSRNVSAQYGLAATPKAAWLLSFADSHVALAFEQSLEARLAPLPLTLIDTFTSQVDSLRRAGLHHFQDILALPGSALGKRCGKDFSHFLQQVLGQQEDLQNNFQPPAEFRDAYWFGYEVKANEEMQPAIELLLQSLCHFLRNTQLQTSDIDWQFIGVDRSIHSMSVRSTSSHSDWRNWHSLTRIRLEQNPTGVGVEGIVLHCEHLRAGELENADLFSAHSHREPLGSLLDRLRSRLGLQAIAKLGCRDEHLPEYAVHLSPDNPGQHDSSSQKCSQRPFWLMPKPEPVQQNGPRLYWNGKLTLVYGPERIEDNWWSEPASRDYYIAQNGNGQYYWVYRDRLIRQWFIHGVFA